MSRARKDALHKLADWVTSTRFRIRIIAAGQLTPGHRIAPKDAANIDRKIGLRLDSGEVVVRDGKTKVSHKVWAQGYIEIEPEDGGGEGSKAKTAEERAAEEAEKDRRDTEKVAKVLRDIESAL
ncbi:hypothetical protein LTR85_009411 [Meristemomyces frigidus]|nr:hypothetical protein LTR85_009411 [Meristemomyces frigidus]